jgi:hypothetical protein
VTWWLLVLTFVSAYLAVVGLPRLLSRQGVSGRVILISSLGRAGLITIAASRLLP